MSGWALGDNPRVVEAISRAAHNRSVMEAEDRILSALSEIKRLAERAEASARDDYGPCLSTIADDCEEIARIVDKLTGGVG